MSQCVPNWDVDDTRFDLRPHPSTSASSAPYVPMLDYEMAELTWENGQLSMHELGHRRLPGKPNEKYGEWERPRAAATGTLESIVNLATQKPAAACDDDVDLVPCFGGQHRQASGGGEALVPACQAAGDEEGRRSADPRSVGVSTCLTRVDSCSGAGAGAGACEPTRAVEDGDERSVRTKARLLPRVQSVSVSGTFAGDSSWHVPTVDTSERVGFTSTTSFCSQGNTLSTSGRPSCTNNTTTVDDHDSVCHSRPQRGTENEEERKKGNSSKSASSNRRSRAAAIHNQSERKRRDKINQRMKTLQKLVPNSNKTDKASMLDEVIDYLKQLQAQVHMMSRMSIPPMMMPQLAIQQQLQMSMMAAAATPMGMGMGFGMGMGMGMAAVPIPAGSIDINMNHMNMSLPPMARQAAAGGGLPQPAAFMPALAAAWDDRFPSAQPVAATAVIPTDPISTFLACQPQPVTVEAYSRMIAMIQQQQQMNSTSKH